MSNYSFVIIGPVEPTNFHDSSSAASAAAISESNLFISCSPTCLATDIISRIMLGSKPAPPRLVKPHTWPFRLTDIETAELI